AGVDGTDNRGLACGSASGVSRRGRPKECGLQAVCSTESRAGSASPIFLQSLEQRQLLSAAALADLLDSGFERVTDVHGAGCACCGCGAGAVTQSLSDEPLGDGHYTGDGHDHNFDHVLLRDASGNMFYYDRAPLPEEGVGFELAPTGGSGGELVPLASLPALASNPGAAQTIYLDFDGQTVRNTYWNNYYGGKAIHAKAYDTDGDASTFSTGEMANIVDIWRRVAEDFAPFDVNVTTISPGKAAFEAGGQAIRVLISTNKDDAGSGGTDDSWFSAAGGVAYLNSWYWSSDTPAWVFYNYLYSSKAIAEAASHEAGHTFGLRHDGQTGGSSYYGGHGSGETGWAPIMGVGYYRQTTQWSKGEYSNADNSENDVSIIASALGYRSDDHGDSLGLSSALQINASGLVTDSGVISRSTDLDYLRFETGGGNVSLNIDPAAVGANLDVLARLYDSDGNLLASSNPSSQLSASISMSLSAGTYYLSIDGTSKGSASNGYSEYGSLGQYSISGFVPDPGEVDDSGGGGGSGSGGGDSGGGDDDAGDAGAGSSISQDRFETNDRRGQSERLIGNRNITLNDLTLHDGADQDWFKYRSKANTQLRIISRFSSTDGDLRLKLYDSDGRGLKTSDGNGNREVVRVNINRGDVIFIRTDSAVGDDLEDYKLIFRQKNVASGAAVGAAMVNDADATDEMDATVVQAAQLAMQEARGLPSFASDTDDHEEPLAMSTLDSSTLMQRLGRGGGSVLDRI
ncbi:MAG: hypothetical protein MI741_13040, partial [Rhodospirillales bacterium]|nr:hypothetical protein [Rhodospirillales bacterium]